MLTPLGFLPSVVPGVAASAAGSFSTGAAERSAKADIAGHALAAGQHELAPNPLDGDPNTAADRDADGWTGGGDGSGQDQQTANPASDPVATTVRPRLPDDPCGGRLDVTI